MLLCMTFSHLTFVPTLFAAGTQNTDLQLNTYSSDLYIYNHLCYTSGAGTQMTNSIGGVFTLMNTSNVNIFIGDVEGAEGAKSPMNSDISIELSSFNMVDGKRMTIAPVNGGKRAVRMSVNSSSSLPILSVEDGAKLTIVLYSSVVISRITLGEGSSLEIQTNGYDANIDTIVGYGDITVTGNGVLNTSSISAGDINLYGVTVDGGTSGSITAEGNITVNGATIKNLALFGYNSSAKGDKTITFNSGSFVGVTTVGVDPLSDASVIARGFESISSIDSSFIFDYTITYKAAQTVLTPLDTWPVSYRVRHASNTDESTTVVGYISNGSFTESKEVVLPGIEAAFYGYKGWLLDGVAITELSPTQKGNIVITAVLDPNTVAVDKDLGYVPGYNTNDDPLPPKNHTTTAKIGDTIILEKPVRFGYVFEGWKIISGANHGVYENSYTISATDLDKVDGTDAYVLKMEAQWTVDTFPMRLIIGTSVHTSKLQVSRDGGNTWETFEQFKSNLPSYIHVDGEIITSNEYIEYGESFEDYITRIFGGRLTFKDTTSLKEFTGWYSSDTGASLFEDEIYSYGEGFLTKPNTVATLSEWHTRLKEMPITFSAMWMDAEEEYTLTVLNQDEWKILVNDTEHTPDASGRIYDVKYGDKITLRCSVNSADNITHWRISSNVTLVRERTHTAGADFYYYDFSMPGADVTMSRHDVNKKDSESPLCVDLSLSSIVFDTGVDYNGRKHDGFYTQVNEENITPLFKDPVKGYFYIWNTTEPFFVTTNNTPTTNQLVIIQEMSNGIHLKNCIMEARTEYTDGAVSRTLDGIIMEAGKAGAPAGLTAGKDWTAYGNIIINNTVHAAYTTTLYIHGDNTVASIFPSNYYGDASHSSVFNLVGDGKSSSKLTLGSLTVLGRLNISDITINSYTDNYEYLLYTLTDTMNKDNIDIRRTDINAILKRIYNSYNYIYVYYDSNINIGSIFTAYAVNMHNVAESGVTKKNNSYIRVHKDIICFYYLVDLQGNANMVVDGGIYTFNSKSTYGTGKLNNNGYLIVKGTGIVGNRLDITGNAVLITNMLSASKGNTFSNGVLVTNQLLNPVTKQPSLSGDKLVINPYTSAPTANDTTYPFYSYSNTDGVASVYTFSGTKVFLFGYYKEGTPRVYNTANDLYDEDNPVKAIMDPLLDEKGDLILSLRSGANTDDVYTRAKAAIEEHIENGTNKDTECVQIGNEKHTTDTSYSKTVEISGGEIYAAGHITLFNKTTVIGGTVVCGGTFSTKRDLTVEGGTITATEIGIAGTATTTEGGLTRYSVLELNSGTLKTDHIGALKKKFDGVSAKGAVRSNIASSVTPLSASEISVYSDLYINYLYDKATYKEQGSNPKDTHFVGTLSASGLSNMNSSELSFTSPVIISTSEEAMWLYDDTNGDPIEGIDTAGAIDGDASRGYVYIDRVSIALYAAKSSYALTVKGDYVNTGFTVSYGSEIVTENGTHSVPAKTLITVSLSSDYIYGRTVIWYKDAAGTIHNIMEASGSSSDSAAREHTFVMPYADAEIYVTDEFELMLDQYSISFTDYGFAIEELTPDRRADSVFEYAGNILISQSNGSYIYNRIIFETSGSGNLTTNRKITLRDVRQDTRGVLNGVEIADGAMVEFVISNSSSGKSTVLAPVNVPFGASVSFVGETSDRSANKLGFRSYLAMGSFYCVGSKTGKAGNISYKDLTFIEPSTANYTKYAYSYTKTTSTVTFENCEYVNSGYYYYDTLVYRMGDTYFNNCLLDIKCSTDLGTFISQQGGNVYYNNTTLNYTHGGTRGSYSPFNCDSSTAKVYVNNSHINISLSYSSSSETIEGISLRGEVIITGNSTVNSAERIMLKSLSVSDTSRFTAFGGEGYVLCPTITVDGSAVLEAGYIIISGFTTGNYDKESTLLSAFAAGTVENGSSYTGLTVNGGTVSAKYALGGALNAKININGGSVNALRLGTLEEYYGFWQKIPQSSGKFVYTHALVPSNTGANITVKGGNINIADGGYLGGMRSKVTMSGGEVVLNGSAVLGITEAQKTDLYNDASSKGQLPLTGAVTVNVTGGTIEGNAINTPYGTVTLSGTSGASVQTLMAENGTITLTTTARIYNNDYPGTDKDVNDAKVGVRVTDRLEALDIVISNGAVVYAGEAYCTASAGTQGEMTVKDSAHLYIAVEFGSRGEGVTDVIEIDLGKIYGEKRFYITYILNGDAIDAAVNDPLNSSYYIAGEGSLTLYPATREGFIFSGWYADEELTKGPYASLTTSVEKNQTLYAKWTPKTVTVSVRLDYTMINDMTYEQFLEEIDGIDGTVDGTTFTFNRKMNIPYRDYVLGKDAQHINLSDYTLKTQEVKETKLTDGSVVTGLTKVTREMLDSELVLMVTLVSTTRNKVILNLNLPNIGEYAYSSYNNINAFDEELSITEMASFLDIGTVLGMGNGFKGSDGHLIAPTAAGYTFSGWYTDKTYTVKVDENLVIESEFGGNLYAKWVANEYYIELDAGAGNDITAGNTVPGVNDKVERLVARISYDTSIASARYYFKLDDGTYVEITEHAHVSSLPYAWAEGYTFDGKWYFEDNYGYKKYITSSTVLNVTNISCGNWSGEIANETGDPVSAVSFYPEYNKIVITYDLNGGTLVGDSWDDNYTDVTESHNRYKMTVDVANMPLIGYVKDPIASADHTVESSLVSDHGSTFSVISTSKEYFALNLSYVSGDFRSQIINKGYTFKGWQLMEDSGGGVLTPSKNGDDDVYIGYVPRYTDAIVRAVWTPNTYKITLNPYDTDMSYPHTAFSDGAPIELDLIVGKEIADFDSIWPSRETGNPNAWFAYDKSVADISDVQDNDRRYLLGFTFDPLDPGVNDKANTEGYDIYHRYSEDITNLINLDCVYTHKNKDTLGSIFGLPSNDDYGAGTNISGINTVPDYPDGSEIDMYAVYRERSLVFVEYYTDNDGQIRDTVLKAFPWTIWSNYPETSEFITRKESVEANGYTLLKMGVNSSIVTAIEYPSTSNTPAGKTPAQVYQTMLPEYKIAAEQTGTYDIMIYTVFVAQVSEDAELSADSSPLSDHGTTFTYTIPNSMQEGLLNYRFSDLDGIRIVSNAALKRFDSSVSDDEVAIYAELYNKNGELKGSQWLSSASGDPVALFTQTAASGWEVRLTLYHSSVMKTEATRTLTLTLGYESVNLKDQYITLNTDINMTPSLYDIEYEAKLPSDSVITEWNGFSDTYPNILRVDDHKYGDLLISLVPTVEGYTENSMWKSEKSSLAYGSPFISDKDAEYAVLDLGTDLISLSTEWIINKYQLSADSALLDRWNIYYGDSRTKLTSSVSIDYRTSVVFSLKTGMANEYPEFVRLETASGEKRLDAYASLLGGEYVFDMPASDIDAFYSRLMELYLEAGSIVIGQNGYTQNGNSPVWRGDYRILMDKNNNTDNTYTDNTLELAADLTDREISLGNLNITAPDSIRLNTAKAELNATGSTVDARSILVPSGSELTLVGGYFILAPDATDAAIGGANGANGKISLDGVTAELTMAPSEASGIGPGNRTSGGEAISLTDCNITVIETSTVESSYKGVWIGGVGVSELTLTDTDVNASASGVPMRGPEILNGDTVSLTGCNIGTQSRPLTDPIRAKDLLTVTDTSIYQSFDDGTAIGTEDSGAISITDSIISSMVRVPDDLYTGTMLINDVTSDVVIANTKILDTSHGDIVITSAGVTQDTTSFTHNNSYLIIDELAEASVYNVTVNSLSGTAIVTIDGAELYDLNINCDTDIKIMDKVDIGSEIIIANGITLTVDASVDGDLSVNAFNKLTSGSYVQSGGKLSGNELGVGGNMTLTDVIASATVCIGSYGVGGVTTVTFDKGSVSAPTIGALGEHNNTFTSVSLKNTPVILDGTLVQDHYRLEYVIDAYYNVDALDKVLRSSKTGSTVTYYPSIPASPIPEDNFLFWYFMGNGDNIYGINSPDSITAVNKVSGLTAEYMIYAEAEASDGTRTLKLLAWMNITIEGVIESGKLFNESEINGSQTSVTIYPEGAFSAKFTVNGSVLQDSYYTIELSRPFAQGAVIRLGVMNGATPIFYYYRCNGDETSIPLSSFTRMGTSSTAPTLLSAGADVGSELSDVLIISVDFEECANNAELSNILLTLKIYSGSTRISDNGVKYSTGKSSGVSVSADGSITVNHKGDDQFDGKNLYLIAEIISNSQLVSGAELMLNMSTAALSGTRLSYNIWSFELGSAEIDLDAVYTLINEGFENGDYTVLLTLVYTSPDDKNVIGTSLAYTRGLTFSVKNEEKGSLTAILNSVDGREDCDRILTLGEVHKALFAVRSTLASDSIEAYGEYLSPNGAMPIESIGINYTNTGEIEAIFYSDLAAGTYRIVFSIDPDITEDDICYVFIIE